VESLVTGVLSGSGGTPNMRHQSTRSTRPRYAAAPRRVKPSARPPARRSTRPRSTPN